MFIDGKSFFDVPVKNKKEAYKKITEIKIIIADPVIYLIMSIFQSIIN